MAPPDADAPPSIAEQNEYAYDAIPYRGYPRFETHPDGLAVRATLFGLEPPALDGARILEIGCGDGGNLIPIAQSLPEATCHGIDLSETQIEMGREVIEAVGLENITLKQGAIGDLAERDEAPWDFILCHGVYSWVTP